MHHDQQHVDVAGRHAWYAACLSECFGVDGGELLSALGRYLFYVVVGEVSFYMYVFEAVHLVGEESFALDITFIFYAYLRGFGYLVGAVGRRHDLLFEARQRVGEHL